MEPAISGPSAAFVLSQLLWTNVRHLLEVLVWAVVLALATAAGTWCCGYAVREVWLKAGPPRRRIPASAVAGQGGQAGPAGQAGPGGPTAEDAVLALEAQRGIREIEKYLAEICPQ